MKYRHDLPQLDGDLFLTDSGLETTLIFHEGLDLPQFASFPLLGDAAGRRRLARYFRAHVRLARRHGVGIVLESPTWRASAAWARRLGVARDALAGLNRSALEQLQRLREELETAGSPIVLSACVGPRGDGYVPDAAPSAAEAEAYHAEQIATLRETPADMIGALTLPTADEATGVARAARAAEMPCAIAFTVETDGRLPTGQPLGEAIEQVDALTARGPAYYMLNCAHPTHFAGVLDPEASWARRLRGVRANASKLSHAELDACTQLDDGDPHELGAEVASLRERLPWLNVLGGCCGTDGRHLDAIAVACLANA